MIFLKNIIKDIRHFLYNLIWAFLDFGLIKIKNDDNKKIFVFRFFGYNICFKKRIRDKNKKKAIYLKINRPPDRICMECIQGWINICYEMGYPFYFVCDNNRLRYKIMRKCYFKDGNIKFIASDKVYLSKVSKYLYTNIWKRCTRAHLLPFFHSKKQNYDNFWSIDADDTIICLNSNKVKDALYDVEKYAQCNNVSAISLDMWGTKTGQRHWSWGVTYVRESKNFIREFKTCKDFNWTKNYISLEKNFNLDWFMTYLRDCKNYKNELFYINNCYFLHCGKFLFDTRGGVICYWADGKLYLPILLYILRNKELGELRVDNCKKIDIGVDLSESLYYYENEVLFDRNIGIEGRNLVFYNNFSNKTKNVLKF